MTKLTRDDWIDAGLNALRAEGFTALKADLLAKRLRVTRGSFYGYFDGIEAYHDAIFAAWLALSQDVAADMPQAGGPKAQLAHLITGAAGADLALERAVRAWAQANPAIQHRLAEVDRYRTEALEAVLAACGCSPAQARLRARLLYASALGAAFVPGDVEAAEVAFLVAAYTQ
ncbi:MAG: TetR/AcrR family transcriptional regulator [Pseudomonadota bacterium]